MRPIFIVFIFIFTFGSLWAQKNVEFEKDNFRDRKKEFKEARKALEDGDDLYMMGKGSYKRAVILYRQANDFNPDNAKLNFKIGKCYLLGSSHKLQALEYFEKAYQLDPRVDPEIHFRLGQCFHLKKEWDKAVNEYKKFQQTFSTSTSEILKDKIAKAIKECGYGKEFVANPERVFIDNSGGAINSKYPDYGPVITADESVMMFTSRRPSTTGGGMDEFIGEHYEDIYITHKKSGAWSAPENMGKPINTDGHDATVGIAPDGQKMLIYLDDKGDGNIYECVLKGDEWSKPKKMDKSINSSYHESSACFSFDGRSLYFVSARPEGSFGGKDIYVSHWNEDKGRWGPAINLGPKINTKYNEDGIFAHPDGKTLYFSSEGHNSMGRYDIFRTELVNGQWSVPVNMGYPINTPDDDVFFVMAGSGKHGYYSSFREGGYGEKDIYMITFLGPEKPLMQNNEDNLLASKAEPIKESVIEPAVQVSRNKVTILKGIVRNAVTLKPLEASIELIDLEQNEMVANFTSNSTSGKYLVSLPSGKNYGIAVKSEGYLFHSENFNVPESAAYKEVVKDIDMKKIEVGSTIILKNIFFDFDKSTLRDESKAELENLYKLLTDNPKLKIEISGHTDSKGAAAYNQQLSESRAKAVVEYLTKKGVNNDRMEFKGYGKDQPIATNDTEEGRQMNRRTEFKVLGL